jgi:ankyrin repeat protein
MDIMEELLKKLEILATIKEGQTISTYGTLSIIEHNAWSTTFWRTYARENRQKTINYIKSILDDAMDHIDNLVVRNLVIKAMQGVSNLKFTYKDDLKIVDAILILLNSYHCLLEPVDITSNTQSSIEEMIQIINEEDLGEKYHTTVEEDDIENIEKNDEDIGVRFLSNVLKKEYVKVEKYLYDGYNVNVTTSDGKNALHLVCDGIYDFPLLKLLYSFHIDTNHLDLMGNDALFYATKRGWTEAVLFLKQNADKKKLATRA